MLCLSFSEMTSQVWKSCPSTSNTVERKNSECKERHPLPLKAAMINVYNIDRVVCCKHITSLKKSSISYRSKTDEAQAADAKRQKKEWSAKSSVHDPEAMWGPDKKCNFIVKTVKEDRELSKRREVAVVKMIRKYHHQRGSVTCPWLVRR